MQKCKYASTQSCTPYVENTFQTVGWKRSKYAIADRHELFQFNPFSISITTWHDDKHLHVINQSQYSNWATTVAEAHFHSSIQSSTRLSRHPVAYNGSGMDQDKSVLLSILVHYYDLFLPPSFTHHSCWFILSAELNTPGWKQVQPQLQIDCLSAPGGFSIVFTLESLPAIIAAIREPLGWYLRQALFSLSSENQSLLNQNTSNVINLFWFFISVCSCALLWKKIITIKR